MFTIYACFVFCFCLEKAATSYDGLMETDPEIVKNLSISAFLDENRNIRINISWENSYDEVELMSVRFLDTDDCNPIDGIERFPIKETTSLIIPPLSLVHPADYLINGCEYEIILETNDMKPNLIQSAFYRIPDCVEDKCKCRSPKDSPYQISRIVLLHNDVYFLQWSKTCNVTLTVLDITYIRENNSTSLTQIKTNNITEDGAEILLPDLKDDVNYRITVRFISDGCYYVSSITMSVPSKKNTMSVILGLVFSVLLLALIVFILTMSFSQLRAKLKKYITCWKVSSEDVYATTPLSFGSLKEQVNPQYTSLEFLKNAHLYDQYEIPRNKIIIKEKIGKGEFGIVYYGEAFELGNNQGFIKVAVKTVRENASSDEKEDLRSEISILKKVGEHKNIIKLLGCVTMTQPYMMILELVDAGSLFIYLTKLREKWSKRRSRFFFTDDMINTWYPRDVPRQPSDNLNYTKIVFEDDGESYFQPQDITLEDIANKSEDNGTKQYVSKFLHPDLLRGISEKSQGPQSPTSFASSEVPSCAETEITMLSSEPPTPFVNEYARCVEAVLDHTELHKFALQVALGMEYLEKMNITHRDLAARNILMTSDKVLKISDFGLSRVGTYVSSIGKKLPLRWMAIEAIEEKVCDSKCDVWSFGVLLWEIGTLGAFPYKNTPNDLILHDLKIGIRLERPKICTDDLYSLILSCWSEKPQDRPTFCEIVQQLTEKQKTAYVDFSVLNPSYVFPPAKEEVVPEP